MTIDQILAAMREIADAAETRDLSDDEVTTYENYEAQVASHKRSQDIFAKQAAYETPVATIERTAAPQDDAYQRAFQHYMQTADDAQLRAQSEVIGSAGGYLVPDTFRNLIVEKKLAFGGFAANAENITTASGNPLAWVTFDDTTNKGAITAEGATFAGGADLTFGTASLGAYKYTTGGASNLPLKISYELIQDSAFDLQSKLATWFATRIARQQAVDFLTGDGSGEPLGLLTPKAVYGSIASTTVPTYAELLATVHALDPAYRAGAKWLMNDASLGIVRGLVDTTGRPLLWDASMNMGNASGGMTLLGYPVIVDQAMPAIATSGSTKWLAFGDFNQAYVIRTVKGFELSVAKELYMNNGQIGFLGWERADGTVQDSNAYVILGSHS